KKQNPQAIRSFRQFGRPTDKILNTARRSIPNKPLKPFLAPIYSHPKADNAEADHSNNFSDRMGHVAVTRSESGIRARSKCGQKRSQATQKFANFQRLSRADCLRIPLDPKDPQSGFAKSSGVFHSHFKANSDR